MVHFSFNHLKWLNKQIMQGLKKKKKEKKCGFPLHFFSSLSHAHKQSSIILNMTILQYTFDVGHANSAFSVDIRIHVGYADIIGKFFHNPYSSQAETSPIKWHKSAATDESTY